MRTPKAIGGWALVCSEFLVAAPYSRSLSAPCPRGRFSAATRCYCFGAALHVLLMGRREARNDA